MLQVKNLFQQLKQAQQNPTEAITTTYNAFAAFADKERAIGRHIQLKIAEQTLTASRRKTGPFSAVYYKT